MRQFGRCFRVDLARSSEGKSRGYAFVEFENAESAAIAAEYLDGSELDGRFLRAEISNFPPDDLIEIYRETSDERKDKDRQVLKPADRGETPRKEKRDRNEKQESHHHHESRHSHSTKKDEIKPSDRDMRKRRETKLDNYDDRRSPSRSPMKQVEKRKDKDKYKKRNRKYDYSDYSYDYSDYGSYSYSSGSYSYSDYYDYSDYSPPPARSRRK